MKINRIQITAAAWSIFLGLLLTSASGQETKAVSSVTFKENHVLVLHDGQAVVTTNDVSLSGEIVVKTNGVFTLKKGKERQLREGQTITADGLLSDPDGSVMPVIDHLVLKGGRVYLVKDGDDQPLGREFALPDGSRVAPDGTITRGGGRLQRMIDGQLIKLDGTGLPATDTVSLREGKTVLFKDGSRFELRRGQFMAMSDGTRVSGDGYLTRPDGTRVTLQEGDVVKVPGVIAPRR